MTTPISNPPPPGDGPDEDIPRSTLAPDAPRAKPPPDKFEPPVGWLVGPQLIASLKKILLHALYAGKLDARDWMAGRSVAIDAPEGGSELWFDYIADSGDGQTATYSIAYLCLSDLFVDGEKVSFDPGGERLPRGSFLFVGGDTAYHVADLHTLGARFQEPFAWAHADVEKRTGVAPEVRPLFGIPGNHDYYDALDGFNRQFRRPATGESGKSLGGKKPFLGLAGFRREQEASYLAVMLPFGWQLWGLDTESDKVDARQLEFFRALAPSAKKLIVATPSPSTAFGRWATAETSTPFVQLKLPLLFLEKGELASGECRLDLSGDVHHYARYFGKAAPPFADRARAPQHPHFASVVSGLGGAFLHPSHTDVREIRHQQRYPHHDASRREVAKRLFNPVTVIKGGYVRVVGFWLAFLLYFASTAPGGFRGALGALLWRAGVSLDGEWPARGAQPGGGLAPLGSSLWVLASFLGAAALCVASVAYANWRARREHMPWLYRVAPGWTYVYLDSAGYAPAWIAVYAAVGLPALAMARNPDATTLDVVAGAVVALLVLGAGLAFPMLVGGGLYRWPRKLFFAPLGLWHVLLQLATPLLLARAESGWAVLAVMGVIGVGCALGWLAASRLRETVGRFAVLAIWLALGAAVIALPIVHGPGAWTAPTTPGHRLVTAIFGGILGMGLSCVWFGWYLAVTLAFNGHNNEAGGAARIERFKQLIRLRVREHDLTGFVIAIDDPTTDAEKLTPHLVDVFTIRPRP